MVDPSEADRRGLAEVYARRGAEDRGRDESERARLLAALPQAVSLLRGLGAGRVWLIGSLAGGHFDERSDVDLVVEGLPVEQRAEAAARLWALLHREVDVLPLERMEPSFARHVRAEGRLL